MKYIIPIIFFLLTACTTTRIIEREVPIEIIKKEYINTVSHDSIHIYDSIDKYIKGDTFYIYKYKDIFKYKYITDTIIKTDSIEVPVIINKETVKEVNVLKWYLKVLQSLGIIVLVMLIIKLFKLIKKL